MTDRQLLQALVAEEERLTEVESKAFESMLNYLRDPFTALTPRQRQWADAVASRIEIDMPPENLHSSGKVAIGKPVETPEILRNLPKRPPGRR